MQNALRLPRFYPVLDTAVLALRTFPARLAAKVSLEAGVKILQYRHKTVWTQREFDDANQIAELCRSAGALFVINDRADFAKLLGAALHIGQEDLPPLAARKIIGTDAVIGFSAHNRRQLSRGDEEPVDYLSIGPIFATTSKEKPDPVLGTQGLARVRPRIRKPVIAIGGITRNNAADVLHEGADSVAIISDAIPEPCDPVALDRRIREWLIVTA